MAPDELRVNRASSVDESKDERAPSLREQQQHDHQLEGNSGALSRSKRLKSQWQDPGAARWPEIVVVCFGVVADALIRDVVAPYAFDWVHDVFHINQAAVYGGLLIGCYGIGSAISSPFFGWLSDRVGRRVLLVCGLLVAGVLTLVGTLSQHYQVALAMRFLAGLLDANQAVSYAALGDLAVGQARQTAFSYAKAFSQVGRILVSLTGGHTYDVRPGSDLRDVPGYDTVLLSQIIAFSTCMLTVLLIFFVYREGPNFRHAHAHPRPVAFQDGDEEQPSTGHDRGSTQGLNRRLESVRGSMRRLGSTLVVPDADEPTLLEATLERRPSSFYQTPPPRSPSFLDGLRFICSQRILLRIILISALTGLLNGGLSASITLLAKSKHGFSMNQAQASNIQALFGAWCVLYTFVFFKRVVAYMGQKAANIMGFFLTGVGLLGLPLTAVVTDPNTPAMWVGVVLSILIYGSGYMNLNSILASLTSSQATPEMQGVTQGISAFVTGILVGVGVPFQGMLFQMFEKRGLFVVNYIIIASGYILCGLILAPVPRTDLEASSKN